jgi:hypothetical protein
MTIEQFEVWLQQNPQSWSSRQDPSREAEFAAWPLQPVPAIYKEFLKQIGAICVFSYCLLGPARMISRTSFIRSLNYPEEGIIFDHLVAFCSQGYDNCYLCFDGGRVIDFDPLNPFSIETVAANSFDEFLARLVESKGESFWSQSGGTITA